jgi:hypothetical protein
LVDTPFGANALPRKSLANITDCKANTKIQIIDLKTKKNRSKNV